MDGVLHLQTADAGRAVRWDGPNAAADDGDAAPRASTDNDLRQQDPWNALERIGAMHGP